MKFVQRNGQNKVCGVYVRAQPGYAEEELDDDHPDILGYQNPPPTQDQIDTEAAKQYAKLNALKGMTPAQISTWVDDNVTNLTQAQDAIKTLAIAVSILARRL